MTACLSPLCMGQKFIPDIPDMESVLGRTLVPQIVVDLRDFGRGWSLSQNTPPSPADKFARGKSTCFAGVIFALLQTCHDIYFESDFSSLNLLVCFMFHFRCF